MERRASIFYPTVSAVLKAYAEIMMISSDSASSYVRDLPLLESALNRPRAAAYYEQADLIQQAASLLWGLVQNHPFVDGNKRTAFVVMVGFLRANGWMIDATVNDKFTLVIGVTQHFSPQDVAEWIREHVMPFDP